MFRWSITGVLVICALYGCGGERELTCEATERYSAAGSIPPVRIPDDLSPPDESESLRLPPPPSLESRMTGARRGCLESPPDYFEGRLADPPPGAVPGGSEVPAEEPPLDPAREITN